MGYDDGWLKLRLHAKVKKNVYFRWSTKEKWWFCNSIKFTEDILFKPTSRAIRKRHHPSPSVAILDGPTVFPVKILCTG